MNALIDRVQALWSSPSSLNKFQRSLLAVHLRSICIPMLYGLGLFTVAYLLVAGQIGMFVFPQPELSIFNQWRFIVSALMIWMIAGITFSKSMRRNYHFSFTAAYLPATFFSGFYLSQITEPNHGVMYILYLVPLFTLVLPGELLERTLATFGAFLILPGIMVARGWDPFLITSTGLVLGSSIFISIIVGHFAIYRMNRINFIQSRELEIQNSRIEELAMFDQLTGLYERHEMDKRLEEEYDRARHYEQKFSVLMIDLDHFKEINDTYGHAMGDTVLETVGNILEDVAENQLRSSDVAGRYGGEEFCIMLPTADRGGARNVAERIRKNLKETDFRTDDGESFQVTCSIGVAELTTDVHEPELLVQRADQALYEAKETGRDQVKLYADLTSGENESPKNTTE